MVSKSRIIDLFLITKIRLFEFKLKSVTGPVIQANGRLTFEDDLRSGGLLYTSIRTGLFESMVTLGEPGNG